MMHRKNPGKEDDWSDGGGVSPDEENSDTPGDDSIMEEGGEAVGVGAESDSDSDSDTFNPADSDSSESEMFSEEEEGSRRPLNLEQRLEPEQESDLDEDDDVIKSMRLAREKKKANHPPDLKITQQSPSCLCFHQTENVLAVATFDGDLRIYQYSDEENTERASVNVSEASSCREIAYTLDGEKMFLAASDSNLGTNDVYLYDVRDGLRLQTKFRNATKAAVSSLYTIDENVFATGDDDGYVMLWDQRSGRAYATLKVSEDCISSMITNHEKRLLACTSTDGSLFSISIRGGDVKTESEIYDSEFNCVGLFKQESKLAVGNGEGSIHVFNWNEFGKHADIYTGIGKKKEPINALIPITERIILTGGEDGCIRAMNFYPQKYLGLVGQVPYSIEKMDVCNDGHLIATLGADEEVIKFWNVSYFENMSVSAEDKVKHMAKPPAQRDDESKSNLPSSSKQNASDFYKGLG